MKEGTRVVVALGAALAAGIGIAASGNESLVRAADNLTPIGTIWVNAIRMTIIPLVVSLLISGVASAADVRAIGRVGGRSIVTFVLLLSGVAVVIMPILPLVFGLLPRNAAPPPLPPGAAEAAGQIAASGKAPGLADWLVTLVPTNPVASAANGAMMPIIIFTLLFALAVTRTPPATRTAVVEFFTALGDAMQVMVHWVVAAAPVGVFALVLPLAAHAGGAIVGGIGFYIAAYSIASLLMVALLYPVVAVAGRVPMARFARAALPAQMIAFSSSSSVASLPGLIEGAKALDLPPRTTGFVLPFAVSTFKLAAPVSWTVGALFIGWFYGVDLHLPQLATVAFAAVFLAFVAPGVPRGAFLMLTPLLVAVGLPTEGVGILIAVDAIPDIFATVLNVTGDLAAAVLVARGDSPSSSSYD